MSLSSVMHEPFAIISDSSLGWPRCSHAHEPGTTAVVDKFGSAFSAGRLPTDDVG